MSAQDVLASWNLLQQKVRASEEADTRSRERRDEQPYFRDALFAKQEMENAYLLWQEELKQYFMEP